MGRAYAGILASLACGITLVRGLFAGADLAGIVLPACGALFLFAALGYLAGQMAELIVRDSVQSQFQAAMADWEKQQPKQSKPTT